MKIGTHKLAATVVVGLSALLVACSGGSGQTGPAEEITLAAYSGSESALVYIAQEQGFFADNGVNVAFKEYEAGKLAADALLAGEADISTSTDFVFVSNSLEQDNLRILGTVAEFDNIELVARADHDISEPADLSGKRVGVTRQSAGEFFLGTFLSFNGLSLADVEIVDLNPSEIVDAITRGDIDAALTWNPNVFNIKQALEDNAVAWPGQSGQSLYFVLLANEQFVSERPEAIARFLGALRQAERFVKENNDEAKEFVSQKFEYEPSYLDAIWPNHEFVLSLPQAVLIVLEDQASWRIANGLTAATAVPNFLEYIYFDGLEAVNPAAITVVR